ncbi:MAG: hypothetical protein QOE61_1007 [Micromonosporaceae bacterium]|jgi:hypothetical protein|nr:hypothetical protein [Micromonosporaceae bacterium]
MRTVRTLVGVVLVLIGVPALALAMAGWSAQRHAGPAGSFSAQLGSVHSDGYAVTVGDVAAVLHRHIATALLRSDRIRVTIGSSTVPVLLWLVPADELGSYLDGVAHTNLAAVGFAGGAQPVQLADVTGTATPAPLIEQPFWTKAPSGRSLEWDRSTDARTSLMLMRADGQAGFGATLTVTVYPSWLDEMTWLSLFVGVAALAVSSAVLFWRRPAYQAFGKRAQALEFADPVAQRVAAASMSQRYPAVTGELVPARLTNRAARAAIESAYVDSAT